MSQRTLRSSWLPMLTGVLWLALPAGILVRQFISQAPPASEAAPPAATYPDKEQGLEKLMKDILRAAEHNDKSEFHSLVSGLSLADPAAWFREVFGSDGDKMLKEYPRSQAMLEAEFAQFFQKLIKEKSTEVSVKKHDVTCDDSSGEDVYPVLVIRQKPQPLYEVRFSRGTRFYPVWALVYVNGGFRFAGNLKVPEYFAPTKKTGQPGQSGSGNPLEEVEKRIRLGLTTVAAKLVRQIAPVYPTIAKEERLEGTVQLHAIIGTDGAVHQLRVLKGYCSLSESAMKAVRGWRYTPTLLVGQPVEVDTFIEVIFKLQH